MKLRHGWWYDVVVVHRGVEIYATVLYLGRVEAGARPMGYRFARSSRFLRGLKHYPNALIADDDEITVSDDALKSAECVARNSHGIDEGSWRIIRTNERLRHERDEQRFARFRVRSTQQGE